MRKRMSNKVEKPKLTSAQLIYKMAIEKGITFKYITEQKAEEN